jgi:membrane protease YdiL (CAAX protease family)
LDGEVTRHPARVSAAAFFVTTFVLSWTVWVPLMLVRLDVLPRFVPLGTLTPLGLVGVLMPGVAATWLTARRLGRSGVRELLGRLLRWRLGRWWWVVLLLQPGLLALTAVIHAAVADGAGVHLEPGLSVVSLLSSVVFLVLAASGEELGWRGLALPALQSRVDPVVASVVLALVTATWHLPYWILQGALADRGIGYVVVDYLFFVALTFQLTWLVNHTGGSVLAAVALHVSFNVVNVAVLPVTESTGAFALLTAAEWVVSAAVVGRLGAPGQVQKARGSPGRSETSGRRDPRGA